MREVMIYQQAIVMLREASDHGNRARRNSNSIEELIAIRAAQEAAHNRNLFGAEFPAQWLIAYWMGREQKVW